MILSTNFSNKSLDIESFKIVYARLKNPAAPLSGISATLQKAAGNALAVLFRKSVVILAVVLMGLSGCSTVNDPVIRVTNESVATVNDIPIVVLPVYNLSGLPAPLSDIRQLLINSFNKAGLNTFDDEVLEKIMAKHRIRHVGGIDTVTAKALKKEAGTETVLLTSLELYSEEYPPKIALTSRLVASDNTTSILWMKGVGLAGDDSPGILGLGLIEDPHILLKMAVQNITASLVEYLSGQKYGIGPPKKRKKFRPKVIYRSPILDPGIKHRVAILPFFNLSERKYAGEIIALHFVKQLGVYENLDVIEPGAIRHALLGLRVIMDDGLSLANADVTFSRLNADLILTGKIMDYQDYQGLSGKPKVDFSAILIERKSREVVWSSKSYNEGDDGVYFFDRGRVNTAHGMASEMVSYVVDMIVEP
jgi:hypothetical protein